MAKSEPKGPAKSSPPLTPRVMNRCAKDVERMKARGADMGHFKAVIEVLCSRVPLPPALNDHPLKGDWKGWRDCHVGPDWIVIYKKTATELVLARMGTHADLF